MRASDDTAGTADVLLDLAQANILPPDDASAWQSEPASLRVAGQGHPPESASVLADDAVEEAKEEAG